MMQCKICGNEAHRIFDQFVLGKYKVDYYRCGSCFFVQTEEPYWLKEAYSGGAIGSLDVGLVERCIQNRELTNEILVNLFQNLDKTKFLDYGGGHGLFTRLMRDRGFNFYCFDLYAENTYAKYFDLRELPENTKFDLLTAFEVLEHLTEPILGIQKMLTLSNIMLFSTELQPNDNHYKLNEWWYLVPEGGQHISFYHENTFRQIAKDHDLFFYTNGKNLHILSKSELADNPFKVKKESKAAKSLLTRIVDRFRNYNIQNQIRVTTKQKSLIPDDFEFVKNKLRRNEN